MLTLQVLDKTKCSIWVFCTFSSVCLLGTSIVLANSVESDLQKVMMYCGIAGSGLFVLSMGACYVNPMNRILFKNNEPNVEQLLDEKSDEEISVAIVDNNNDNV
jgi:hypothetical protein